MGFFSRLVKEVIGDGIAKGIGDAVGKATEKAVAPAAEKLANETADRLNQTAKVIGDNKKETGSGQDEAIGRLEQTAERLEQAAALQEDLIKEWNQKVPGFPVWCFGGTKFWFEETGTAPDGGIYYVFCADNAPEEGLKQYVSLLKQNGFVRKYSTSDEVLYKDLGGEYLVLGTTAAFEAAPVMTLNMVRTSDRSEIEE